MTSDPRRKIWFTLLTPPAILIFLVSRVILTCDRRPFWKKLESGFLPYRWAVMRTIVWKHPFRFTYIAFIVLEVRCTYEKLLLFDVPRHETRAGRGSTAGGMAISSSTNTEFRNYFRTKKSVCIFLVCGVCRLTKQKCFCSTVSIWIVSSNRETFSSFFLFPSSPYINSKKRDSNLYS